MGAATLLSGKQATADAIAIANAHSFILEKLIVDLRAFRLSDMLKR